MLVIGVNIHDHIPSLKLTEHLKHWGWKMSFLLGRRPARCYVSFGECIVIVFLLGTWALCGEAYNISSILNIDTV